MAYEDYLKAQKQALKAFKEKTAKGQYPYLPVLDEILSHAETEGEVHLGIMNITLSEVVGTSTAGRTQAFACNFMPLLDYGSEFSAKWSHLVDAQIEEGIHDAIKVYEYMNRYYVVEGNKRASVLKYFESPTILADVTRKVPKRSEDLDVKIYYEYMDFYNLTKINYVHFTKLGSYAKLQELIGKEPDEVWTEDDCMDFSSFHVAFSNAYMKNGGYDIPYLTVDDAILFYLTLYPYEESKNSSGMEVQNRLNEIWSEITNIGKKDNVELLMEPTTEKQVVVSALNKIIYTKKKIAFVYDKEPSTSDWIYSHELGRLHLVETFGDSIETHTFITPDDEEEKELLLEKICEDKFDIIFTITPMLIKPSIKAAAKYPNVKILNCAPYSSYNTLRTYYTRMYEAKFLTGIIAGTLCENDKIGYIADYPIYGVTANINAFALGAKMVNPNAKVYLAWSTTKLSQAEKLFWDEQINYISSQDMITPTDDTKSYGLYSIHGGQKTNLAMSIYQWGIFYEKLVNQILEGGWKIDEKGVENKALNYWWGLSAGAIDVICSKHIPPKTAQLVSLMKDAIANGKFHPFCGPLYDQDQQQRISEIDILKPEDIITMDWLVDNVVGSIPEIEDLVDSAKDVVQLRGVSSTEKGGTSVL